MNAQASGRRIGRRIFGVSALVLVGSALLVATARAPRSVAATSPVYGVALPVGYRDWKLISVAQENGKNNDIRAILGNDIAIRAFREGARPFPDGTVIVRLAWRYESSPRNDAVFPAPQSFVAGEPTNVQVSVKNAQRYAASGGWGYGQFERGVADQDQAITRSCFTCHARLEPSADLVFTRYAR